MSRKSKYSFEQKKWAVEQYLNGNMSAAKIAIQLNMSKNGSRQILSWARQYQSNQDSFLSNAQYNNHYSKELKKEIVQEYLHGNRSLASLANKYGIRSPETVRKWVSKYNSHIENQDYNPHPEVYMTERQPSKKEFKLFNTVLVMIKIIQKLLLNLTVPTSKSTAGPKSIWLMVKQA